MPSETTTTTPPDAESPTWQDTVRSWGLTPFLDEYAFSCKGSWTLGTACGRCERCATADDRPPVDADLDQRLARRDASYRNALLETIAALLETIAAELVTIRGVLERQEDR